jgi:hypothetical protein
MRQLVFCALAATIAGCGGGGGGSTSSEEEGLSSDTSGDETVSEEGGGTTDEEPVAERPSGPGQLRIAVKVGGQEASGTVRVVSSSGETVAEGRSGETFTVPSGDYTISASITDDDVMIDTPTRENDQPVSVMAGQESSAEVDFPVSRVRIRVTRRGRAVSRWRMEVRPQADESAEAITLQPSQDHIAITPGRYAAVVHLGAEQITINEIIFQGGARMDVPVNIP